MQVSLASIKSIIFNPIKTLRQTGFASRDSFEAIQRERFLLANILALGITTGLSVINQILPDQVSTGSNLIVNMLSTAWWLFSIHAAFTWPRIETLCRLWMCLSLVALSADSIFGGGITGHTGPLILLLPIGAGLLLRTRDVFLTAIATVVIVGMIGFTEIAKSPASEHHHILTDMALLMVTVIVAAATMLTLVIHHSRVDRALRKILLTKDYLVAHDSLTGLMNRTTITEHLNALQPESEPHNLFLLDLDGFKAINDAYGHDAGDRLLIEVAKRLQQSMPEDAKIARLGGDEFLMLVKADKQGNTINPAHDGCPGKIVIAALNQPIFIDNIELQVTGSIGIAHFPQDAEQGHALLKRADLALYAAKASGRNQCSTFNTGMEAAQRHKIRLQNRLKTAIAKGDISLHYQPQICMQTGALYGFEALARWHDDILGLIMPSEFIPIAEECGLIIELGEQILRRACREALEWPRLNEGQTPLQLSVNISSLQLSRANIVTRVQTILDETGFPANQLELEITESVLISDPEKVAGTLNQLSELGIAIAMDDFGKGYSSLAYLRNFSLTRLKIDRSFIIGLEEPNGTPIVRAIIQLAKAMDLQIVAEGIETEAQRQILRQLGCDYGQGYLYAKGLPQNKSLAYIIEHAKHYPFRKPAKTNVSPPLDRKRIRK